MKIHQNPGKLTFATAQAVLRKLAKPYKIQYKINLARPVLLPGAPDSSKVQKMPKSPKSMKTRKMEPKNQKHQNNVKW